MRILLQPTNIPPTRLEYVETKYRGSITDVIVVTAQIFTNGAPDPRTSFPIYFGHRSGRASPAEPGKRFHVLFPDAVTLPVVVIERLEEKYLWMNTPDGFPMYPLEELVL